MTNNVFFNLFFLKNTLLAALHCSCTALGPEKAKNNFGPLRMINNDTNNIHPKSLQGKCVYLGNKLFAKGMQIMKKKEFCKFYLVNIFNH